MKTTIRECERAARVLRAADDRVRARGEYDAPTEPDGTTILARRNEAWYALGYAIDRLPASTRRRHESRLMELAGYY